ncbi:MAG: hypothetical protein GY739_19510 [Mesoflavibacter sp.]|nr:hypothetical protein [Mesoflavibacter sp.]
MFGIKKLKQENHKLKQDLELLKEKIIDLPNVRCGDKVRCMDDSANHGKTGVVIYIFIEKTYYLFWSKLIWKVRINQKDGGCFDSNAKDLTMLKQNK